MSNIINGVNVAGLQQTIDAVKANPAVAKFRFRLNNEWLEGSHSRSTVNGFYGATQEFQRTKSFLLDADEPAVLLGRDQAPNPVEYLLAGLASCVTTSLVYHAAARGIEIKEIETTFEGDIDLHGFLDLDQKVRNGFQNIRMTLAIHADVSDEQLQELAVLGPRFSPVFDSITNGVPIMVQAERMKAKKAANAA